jgi:FkbM family methyltransferase
MISGISNFARCVKHNLFDYTWFKVNYHNRIFHIETSDGVFLNFPHNPYLSFYQIGGYLREGKWILEPGMSVVDAGACLGEFALYASARVGPRGRVFLMEPDPDNLRLLDHIFSLNGGKPANLEVIEQGLWDRSGVLKFEAGYGQSSALAEMGNPPQTSTPSLDGINEQKPKSIIVKVMSIPDLVDRFLVDRLDFVKMDIEGAEIEAVHGAHPVMDGLKPRFAIASYHVRNGTKTAETLKNIFYSYNYHVLTGFNDHLTTYASPVPFLD